MIKNISLRFLTYSVAVLALVALFAAPAFADHGDEPEESHVTTVNAHMDDPDMEGVQFTVTYNPVVDVTKVVTMQELLKALQQLVGLLEKQKEQIEHDSTPHEHDEDDDHDEDEDEEEDNENDDQNNHDDHE